ncbi:hypothetical protein I3760_09G163800 [Carya illinoinensis]|nr:hypothetical protein I3760_09G163800 [Carya illinoinensis]
MNLDLRLPIPSPFAWLCTHLRHRHLCPTSLWTRTKTSRHRHLHLSQSPLNPRPTPVSLEPVDNRIFKDEINTTAEFIWEKWNVVMVGNGMTTTIVSGNLNFVDGTPTFSITTFAVFGKGKGFIARDMGFPNNAGAIKHQAVALMSNSNLSILYQFHIDAVQDTLYTHANQQFYRECNIYGTIDFIPRNSIVVMQWCKEVEISYVAEGGYWRWKASMKLLKGQILLL